MIELVYAHLASLTLPMETDMLVFALRDMMPLRKVIEALESLERQGRAQCDDDGWRIKIEEVKKPKQLEMFAT